MREIIEETVIVNDKEIPKEKLQEVRDELKPSERLAEVKPGEFKKLNRMNG